VIVALGKSALESLMYQEWKKDLGPLTRWLGWNIPSKLHGAWICPTYHPSYIVRMGDDKLLTKIMQNHIKKAMSLEKEKVKCYDIRKLENKIEIITDSKQSINKMKELNKKEGVLAFDYETTGLKPDKKGHRIVSVSFCLNGKETWASSINEDNMIYLSHILRNKKLKKVASNLKFEERWTRAMFGHGVTGWVWDTMLASHILDNRSGITSIKFQAYIHLGISDYDSHIHSYFRSQGSNGFNKIDDLSVKDLLLYNGLDSLLEFMIMKRQRRMFQ
jgi:hypothetical protein